MSESYRKILFTIAASCIAVSTLLLSSQSAQQQGGQVTPTWYQIRTTGGQAPSHLSWACAVYEPERRRMLVFGGKGIPEDGVPTPEAPPATSTRNQVWALSLVPGKEMWELLRPKGRAPRPRQEAACAYDPPSKYPRPTPSAGRVIIFGGYNDEKDIDLADTPIFDLSSPDGEWLDSNILPHDSPKERQGATLVYQCMLCGSNDELHHLILFGGYNKQSNQPLNDVWVFSPNSLNWQPLALKSPEPPGRDGHIAVVDVANQRMIVFGGADRRQGTADQPKILHDVWALDLTPGSEGWWSFQPGGDVPDGLVWSAATEDERNSRLLMFGGLSDHREVDDTWQLALGLGLGKETWTNIITNVPRPRKRLGHNMVFDSGAQAGAYIGPDPYSRLVIFGGMDAQNEPLRDVWALQLSGEIVTGVVDPPTAILTSTPISTPTPTAAPIPTITRTPTKTPAPQYYPLALYGRREAVIIATPTPGPCADEYEWDNILEYAKAITTTGEYQIHTIHEPEDVDWVKFVALAGQQYTIEISGDLGVDTYIELYDRWETSLDKDDDTNGLNPRLRVAMTATQELYVKIGETKKRGRCDLVTRFGYLVHITAESKAYLPNVVRKSRLADCQLITYYLGGKEQEDNDSCEVADCLPLLKEGQLLLGTMHGGSPGDDDNEDYYRIRIPRDGVLHVDLKANIDCQVADYDLYLYNSVDCADAVATSKQYCVDEALDQRDVSANTVYYIRVNRYSGGSSSPYSLIWNMR